MIIILNQLLMVGSDNEISINNIIPLSSTGLGNANNLLTGMEVWVITRVSPVKRRYYIQQYIIYSKISSLPSTT